MTPAEWIDHIDKVLAENAKSATDKDYSVADLVSAGILPPEALDFLATPLASKIVG